MTASSKEIAEKLAELNALFGDTEQTEQPLFSEIWASWEKGMCATKSKATCDSIHAARKHLDPIIGKKHVSEITGELWINLVIPTIRKETHAEFKFANCRKWLSMCLKFADENNKAPNGWKRPKLMDPDPEIAPGRAYSVAETDALIAHADWLLKPKIIMALDLYMRRSEIALLSKERVDRVRKTIHLRAVDTKIRKPRSFPYSDRVEEQFKILDSHYAHLNSPWIFPSPIDHMKSIGRDGFATAWSSCKRRAGVVGKFHWLRHTALTRAFKSGKNQMLVCEMAGLDISMAQKIYNHTEVDDMRELLK